MVCRLQVIRKSIGDFREYIYEAYRKLYLQLINKNSTFTKTIQHAGKNKMGRT